MLKLVRNFLFKFVSILGLQLVILSIYTLLMMCFQKHIAIIILLSWGAGAEILVVFYIRLFLLAINHLVYGMAWYCRAYICVCGCVYLGSRNLAINMTFKSHGALTKLET